ncbi:MAG: sensor histidine kinase [Methanohalobium sp.]|uniref:sensor histidine kinase n=1 Tax=Methanohalobium sp. TaxID=2837493 RepID=UPI00397BA9CF
MNTVVQQAFSNLISNSIKYSPEGSEVIVDILDKGDYWKIRVKDSGPGIPDEDKSQLFDRFKRGKAKTTAGKGLGLSIVKSIIDLHGGSVDVEDNPDGEGSMFWISVEKSR